MAETPEIPRSDERRTFDELMTRAAALAAKDHEGARDLLKEAYRASLPNGETALLQAEIAASTGLTMTAIKALTIDAANHAPEHGYLPGVDEIERAMRAEMERRFGGVIETEGRICVYADAPSADTRPAETGYWRTIDDSKLEEILLKSFGRVPAVQKSANRKEVINRLRSAWRVEDDYLQPKRRVVAFANGALRVDPATGLAELLPHSKEHRNTYRLLFCYDPQATAPIFEDGLLRMVGDDQDKAACLLQFMFCVLFGYMPPLDRVRTVLILFGPTGSGKSTLTELIRRLLPAHVQASIPPELWGNGYYLAKLRGVLLNTVTELEPTARAIKGAAFKLVASHEQVTARQIRQEPVTFNPEALHLLSCNRLPTLGEGDRSLERRVIVVGAPRTPEEAMVNPKFLDEVWAEAPGIVNVIIQEAAPMLTSGKFTLPADNQQLVVQMQFPGQPEEHVARLWLEPAPGERVWSTDLQRAIRIEAEGLDIDTSGWQSSARMKTLAISIGKLYGATRHVTEGKPYYQGVRLKHEFVALLRNRNGSTDLDLAHLIHRMRPPP